MPIFQSFNPRIGAWVKYDFKDGKPRFFDVKEKEPLVPFKNIRKK
jgi:hypothetical protein